jgi:hypothetical protein
MLRKVLVTTALLAAGITAAAAAPAHASPSSIRADFGKNNGATIDARWDNHGVRSNVRLGGLTAGTYTYSIVIIWTTSHGDVSVVTPVCSSTLKAGQQVLECGAENLNPFAGYPAGGTLKKYQARVTRQGAAGNVALADFH